MRSSSYRATRNSFRLAAYWVLVATCVVAPTSAFAQSNRGAGLVELQLRERVKIESGVVTLGDLTIGIQADPQTAKALRAIELFPAPTSPRRYRADEIAERLSLRGVDLGFCRFAGATSVLIESSASQVTAVEAGELQTSSKTVANEAEVKQKAADRIRELAVDLLRQRVFASGEWGVQVEMETADAALVASPANRLAISGIGQPWIGSHQATIRVTDGTQTHMVHATIQITSKTMAVVARVPIERGVIINVDHVELAPISDRVVGDDLVYEVDLVVGSEAKNTIRPGQHVTATAVRKPILVRRGDTVEMIANAGGVSVRRFGRATQDGSLDSIIGVESLDRDRKFNARVSGYQTVTVLGNAGRPSQVNR